MLQRVQSIEDVAARQLCCGCGACAYVSPDRYRMVDVLDHGRRPERRAGAPESSRDDAFAVCPGVELAHGRRDADGAEGLIRELLPAWGPILEVWEGYASDPEIRFAGSSGGAASAIALYCIERGGMHGVLHIAARPDVPYLNRTVLSTTREEIVAATGSRYAPASPCDGLRKVEEAPGPCVFVGKPCDVAALAKVRALRGRLDSRIGVTLGFFCAGTPSTRGTLEMLEAMGIGDPASLSSVRYRGMGWPGKARARMRSNGDEETRELTYEQSWGGILEKHRQWRCYVCADHTGEFADIAVGDPWYRSIPDDEPGRSLVLARTERGRRIIAEAAAAGYVSLERAPPRVLPDSQPNLLRTRGAVWGRILGLKLMGAAAPTFRGMPMFRFWCTALGFREKLQSVLGTVKRVFRKRLRTRVPVEPYLPAETDHEARAAANQ